jgi:hypothetical protein
MKKVKEYYQQGDVLIGPCEIPTEAFKTDSNVLQEGEFTGHAHRLHDGEFEVHETPNRTKYLRALTPVSLRHEEHHEIQLPPGDYKIGIVEEFDPFEDMIRKVMD